MNRSLLRKLFGKGTVAALLLSVLLISSGTAWAQYTPFGVGLASCAIWTEKKNEGPAEGLEDMLSRLAGRIQMEQWVYGYLTAYSQWVEVGLGPVSDSEYVGAIAWIDNYCQENPLKNLAWAAEQLIYAIEDN